MSKLLDRKRRPQPGRRLLRPGRVVVSLLMLTAALLMFCAAGSSLALAMGWVARIQIMPLVLSASVGALALWGLATLVLGRVYCGMVCPLGIMQDVIGRLEGLFARLTGGHPYHRNYRYTPPANRLRYTLLAVVVLSYAVGLTIVVGLTDPYSAFGRIATQIISPVLSFTHLTTAQGVGAVSLTVALLTLVVTGYMSLRYGRLYCNTVCPVGSALSLVSRVSLLHFDIDTDRCINCRKCEHVCKSGCIDLDDHVVDSSRCVVCFDCMDVCPEDAISYTINRKRLSDPLMQRIPADVEPAAVENIGGDARAVDSQTRRDSVSAEATPVKIDRRRFLATGLLVASLPAMRGIVSAAAKAEAAGTGKREVVPDHPVAPPGRRNMEDFLEKCTGCGLCVAHCPTGVIRPSSDEYGWLYAMRPVMDYDSSYCRYDCTDCTRLCPTSALEPLTPDEKHIFIIGHARVEPANCIGCGFCVDVCPRHTIGFVSRPADAPGRSPMVAQVDPAGCIGCGRCQNVCPARPYKAIIVNGII